MSSLGNTLFLKMLENSQAQAAAAQQNRMAELEQQDRNHSQMSELFNNTMKMQGAHFDRQMALVKMQSELGGEQGIPPKQQYENEQLQMVSETGYGQGMQQRQAAQVKAAVDARDYQLKERDVEAKIYDRRFAESERLVDQRNRREDKTAENKRDQENKNTQFALMSQGNQIRSENSSNALTLRDELKHQEMRKSTLDTITKANLPNILGSFKRISQMKEDRGWTNEEGPSGVSGDEIANKKFWSETAGVAAKYGLAAVGAVIGGPVGVGVGLAGGDGLSQLIKTNMTNWQNADLKGDALEFKTAMADIENMYLHDKFGSALTATELPRAEDLMVKAETGTWPQRWAALAQLQSLFESKLKGNILASNGTVTEEEVLGTSMYKGNQVMPPPVPGGVGSYPSNGVVHLNDIQKPTRVPTVADQFFQESK